MVINVKDFTHFKNALYMLSIINLFLIKKNKPHTERILPLILRGLLIKVSEHFCYFEEQPKEAKRGKLCFQDTLRIKRESWNSKRGSTTSVERKVHLGSGSTGFGTTCYGWLWKIGEVWDGYYQRGNKQQKRFESERNIEGGKGTTAQLHPPRWVGH